MDLDRTLAFVPGVSRAQGSPLSGAEWWELIRFAGLHFEKMVLGDR